MRLGLTMRSESIGAICRVLEALDRGGDVRQLMRAADFRDGRAVLQRAEMRARSPVPDTEPGDQGAA